MNERYANKMTVGDLTSRMYYAQRINIFEVDPNDRLNKTSVTGVIENSQLLSDKYKKFLDRDIIGFGNEYQDNVIAINIDEITD